jgi:hypothetical protein
VLRARIDEPVSLFAFNVGSAGRVHLNFPTRQHTEHGLGNPLAPGERRIPLGYVSGPPDRSTFVVVATASPVRSAYMEDLARELAQSRPMAASEVAGLLARGLDVRREVQWAEEDAASGSTPDATWIFTRSVEEVRRELGPGFFRFELEHR